MYHVKQSRLLAGIQKAKLTWFLQTSKTRQATSPTPTRDRRKRELNQCVRDLKSSVDQFTSLVFNAYDGVWWAAPPFYPIVVLVAVKDVEQLWFNIAAPQRK
jgi:hypothetical protein